MIVFDQHVRAPCSEYKYIFRHSSEMPTTEIDRIIRFNEYMISDCESRIRELKSLKKVRLRAVEHKENMNRLAAMFYNRDNFDRPKEQMLQIIGQRIGYEHGKKRIEDIYEILQTWAKRQQRIDRDKYIAVLADTGEYTVTDLAKKFNLSRPTVTKAIKKHKTKFMK